VSQLMNTTYILQRQDLVGVQPIGARDVKIEWPFLYDPKWLIGHLERLLGLNELEKLDINVLAKKEMLVQYFKSVSKTMKTLADQLTQFDTESHRDIGVLLLTMAYFSDNVSVLFHYYEVCIFSSSTMCTQCAHHFPAIQLAAISVLLQPISWSHLMIFDQNIDLR
jgi:hypothetical protein